MSRCRNKFSTTKIDSYDRRNSNPQTCRGSPKHQRLDCVRHGNWNSLKIRQKSFRPVATCGSNLLDSLEWVLKILFLPILTYYEEVQDGGIKANQWLEAPDIPAAQTPETTIDSAGSGMSRKPNQMLPHQTLQPELHQISGNLIASHRQPPTRLSTHLCNTDPASHACYSMDEIVFYYLLSFHTNGHTSCIKI
jgi:hypothetical protein